MDDKATNTVEISDELNLQRSLELNEQHIDGETQRNIGENYQEYTPEEAEKLLKKFERESLHFHVLVWLSSFRRYPELYQCPEIEDLEQWYQKISDLNVVRLPNSSYLTKPSRGQLKMLLEAARYIAKVEKSAAKIQKKKVAGCNRKIAR